MFVVSKIRMAEELGTWEKTGLRRRLGYLVNQTPVGRGDRSSLFLMELSVIVTFDNSNIGGIFLLPASGRLLLRILTYQNG